MVHSISTQSQSGTLQYFQELCSLFLHPDTDLVSKLERLFAVETIEFDLDHAFLARIDLESETQHFQVVHNPDGSLTAGNTVPLSTTYCRKTIADADGTIVVNDALVEGWDGDPAYEKFNLGTYIGTTVTTEDNLYGTLCFANTTPRETPITKEERTLIELFSQWVRYELNQWRGPETHDTVHDGFREHDIAPSEIDKIMESLSNQTRRTVLRIFLDENTEKHIDEFTRRIETVHTESQLYHQHLPRLEQAGYITWNRDSNLLSRGPYFFKIKPLVQLLDECLEELSE